MKRLIRIKTDVKYEEAVACQLSRNLCHDGNQTTITNKENVTTHKETEFPLSTSLTEKKGGTKLQKKNTMECGKWRLWYEVKHAYQYV